MDKLRVGHVLGGASVVALVACAGAVPPPGALAPEPEPMVAPVAQVSDSAWFVYDRALVPEGASARVQSVATGDGRTFVVLHAYGLLPDRTYGAHAHKQPCGTDPKAAGGHYQHEGTAVTAENEIWLDLHTNAAGNGESRAVVNWQFDTTHAQSVVLHSEATDPTRPPSARVACLTADL
jgi:Cu-Zn family superoxide dismutase